MLSKYIEILGNDIIIGLEGNKSDLSGQKDINIDIVKKFAKEKDIVFKETSALSHDYIENYVEELVHIFYDIIKDSILEINKNVFSLNNNNHNIRICKGCCILKFKIFFFFKIILYFF